MARILHRAVVGAGLIGLLAVACAPGEDNDGTAEGDDTPPASEPAEIDEEVTLIVWDQEVRGGQNEVIEELNAAFMEVHPNITIERVSRSFEDLQTTLPLALTGDDAPDVVQANNGRPIMGSFGEGSLYGLAQQGELVGVFYNRAKLDELGIEVPQTWEDFLAAAEAATEAGEVALPLGNIDQ